MTITRLLALECAVVISRLADKSIITALEILKWFDFFVLMFGNLIWFLQELLWIRG